MKPAQRFAVVLVTAPDLKTGRRLTKMVLRKRLAACVNLVSGIESHYWWRGQIESSREVLLLLKTSRVKLPALEKLILAQHPYDTPELVALALSAGNHRYLDWLAASLSAPARSPDARSRKRRTDVPPATRSF